MIAPCEPCRVSRLSTARMLLLSWIFYISAVAALPRATSPVPSALTTQAVNNSSPTFLVYPTPDFEDNPLEGDAGALLPGEPVTMVFHGFKGDRYAKSMRSIKEALLNHGVRNVVVVDWSSLADAPGLSALDSYRHVCAHGVPEAARIAHAWLQAALRTLGLAPHQLHLIGFSLGAHVAGVMGSLFNSTVGRISGLDPPLFGYERTPLTLRLDADDAEFVNVIHSSAGILSFSEPIGHVDFFPNGDVVPQVGCPHESPIHIITCSHYFAFAVFAESIYHPRAFMATECDSWHAFTDGECDDGQKAAMGYSTPNTTRGMFFMATKDSPPFGEDDPDNPLPETMVQLLTYDKEDSFVKPQDVVKFLMHKEPGSDEKETNEEQHSHHEHGSESHHGLKEHDSKVMKVKSPSPSTTTEDPPAFLNGSSIAHVFHLVLICLTGVNLVRLIAEALGW